MDAMMKERFEILDSMCSIEILPTKGAWFQPLQLSLSLE